MGSVKLPHRAIADVSVERIVAPELECLPVAGQERTMGVQRQSKREFMARM
jgi:hypothetical protein